MRRFGKIENLFWDTVRHEKISDEGKLLGAYLLTCQYGETISVKQHILQELNWDIKTLSYALQELDERGFVTCPDIPSDLTMSQFVTDRLTTGGP
ncbi:hypothetical protein [Endozoicomonas sp. ONNA2]|uniref:hypothetical protein n=1 Tax=Endozoicomonas sp. ONNA2 TaxID=2828741 RepID=UPI0021498C26|nr:hypothetical protein [Endozoicomonas sp. ONNA2]